MELGRIMENFSLFSGMQLTEAMAYMPLCRWAMGAVTAALKPGAEVLGNEERLELVAGALAYRHYAQTSEDAGSMTVGDIRVEASAKDVSSAEEIWQEMWGFARDILTHPAGDLWLCC